MCVAIFRNKVDCSKISTRGDSPASNQSVAFLSNSAYRGHERSTGSCKMNRILLYRKSSANVNICICVNKTWCIIKGTLCFISFRSRKISNFKFRCVVFFCHKNRLLQMHQNALLSGKCSIAILIKTHAC